jgi:hypothetical protein
MTKEHGEDQLDDKCFQLVGEFLSQWALLESALDEGLSIISRMELIETIALRTQLNFRNKIDLFQQLIVTLTDSDEEKQVRKGICENIRSLSSTRNMIVHSLFSAEYSSDGQIGVRFFKSKKDKEGFKIDEKVIDEDNFYEIFDSIDNLIELVNTKSTEASGFRMMMAQENKRVLSFTIPVEKMGDAGQSGLGALFQLIQLEQSGNT